jgi:hypothetical protein
MRATSLFAGAGLALDDHGGVGGSGPRHGLVDLHHGRRAADHLRLGQFLFFGFAPLIAARRLGTLDGVEQHVELEGFGDVIENAAAGSGHHRLDRAAAGHQDHRTERILALGGVQYVEAGALIDIDIGDHDRIASLPSRSMASPVVDTASTAYPFSSRAVWMVNCSAGSSSTNSIFCINRSVRARPP